MKQKIQRIRAISKYLIRRATRNGYDNKEFYQTLRKLISMMMTGRIPVHS
ncbi:MAG: hypothetical protein ACFE7E_03710 [Candidatus Hodarchaeota archaeon]